MEMSTQEQKLMARAPVLEEELDFENIKEITKKAKQAMIPTKKPISDSELKAIPRFINDMVRYIKKYAAAGKSKFDYDCSKLSEACFYELARQFKEKYKEFFVVTQGKSQILTVDWSGKSEV